MKVQSSSFLLLLAASCSGSASAVFTPTRISFASLMARADGDDSSAADSQAFLKALQDVGMVSVTDIPDFFKKEALGSLAACLEDKPGVGAEHTFADGTLRRTIATYSLATKAARPMDELKNGDSAACRKFNDATVPFRQAVADVTVAVAARVAGALGLNGEEELLLTADDEPFSFRESIELGEQLEHFHAYYQTKESSKTTLDWHIDQGLLLLFTPGESNGVPTEGFYIELADGSTEMVKFEEKDELVFFFGDGVNQYVNPFLKSMNKTPLRALPHALQMPATTTTEPRVWYGRMVLPPADALHPHARGGETFGALREFMIQHKDDETSLSLSCSSATHVATTATATARALNDDNNNNNNNNCTQDTQEYCWHRCMNYTDFDASPDICEGRELTFACANEDEGLWDEMEHNPDYAIRCVKEGGSGPAPAPSGASSLLSAVIMSVFSSIVAVGILAH